MLWEERVQEDDSWERKALDRMKWRARENEIGNEMCCVGSHISIGRMKGGWGRDVSIMHCED